jgi:hypothetical protein
MAVKQDIQGQLILLESHRRTLHHHLKQLIIHGEANVPSSIAHGILESRENISRIKTILRNWGVATEDHPDDDEPATIQATPSSTFKSLALSNRNFVAFAGVVLIAVLIAALSRNISNGGSPSLNPTSASPPPPTPVSVADPSGGSALPIPPTIASSAETPLPTFSSSAVITTIDRAIPTFNEKFTVKLRSIQIEPGKSIRWNFELRNGTSKDNKFVISGTSYVVDDLGNKYDLMSSLNAPLQTGVYTEQSATFSAPKPGVRVSAFTLYIAESEGVQVRDPAISVSGIQNPPTMPQPIPTVTIPSILKDDTKLPAKPKDFIVTLKSIQVEPGKSMRWNFELWNKTAKDNTFVISETSYVVDDLGNEYELMSPLTAFVQAGVRTEQSATFSPPKLEASVFTLNIAGFQGVKLDIDEIKVLLK